MNKAPLVISGDIYASEVIYPPSVPSNWPTVPSDVQEALDDIAAAGTLVQTSYTVRVRFTYTSSFPITAQVVTNGETIIYAKILITTPFSAGCTLAFGTSTTSALIFGPEISPQVATTYVNDSLYEFSSTDNLIVSASVSGATQGAGTLIYTIK